MRADGTAICINADEPHIRIEVATQPIEHRSDAGLESHTFFDVVRDLPGRH